jgi:hypothetical protein
MSISARSDETEVGMARCAVPAAFSAEHSVPRATNGSLDETPVPRLNGEGTPRRSVPAFSSVWNIRARSTASAARRLEEGGGKSDG